MSEWYHRVLSAFYAFLLTCVWYERDLEEGSYHPWNIARLVVTKNIPLVDHQTIHGNPHISIATYIHTYEYMIVCSYISMYDQRA